LEGKTLPPAWISDFSSALDGDAEDATVDLGLGAIGGVVIG
jgi:hypothetical protein